MDATTLTMSLRQIFTVISVQNTEETGDIYTTCIAMLVNTLKITQACGHSPNTVSASDRVFDLVEIPSLSF